MDQLQAFHLPPVARSEEKFGCLGSTDPCRHKSKCLLQKHSFYVFYVCALKLCVFVRFRARKREKASETRSVASGRNTWDFLRKMGRTDGFCFSFLYEA